MGKSGGTARSDFGSETRAKIECIARAFNPGRVFLFKKSKKGLLYDL